MWPVTRTTRNRERTGNSCTTGFIRAPVGSYKSSHSYIGTLEQKVKQARISALGGKGLMAALTGKSSAERERILSAVKRALPTESTNIGKLKAEVDLVTSVTPKFPLELLGRETLASMANITGDPVGPGMARQKFRAAAQSNIDVDSQRVGLVIQFEKGTRDSSYYF